ARDPAAEPTDAGLSGKNERLFMSSMKAHVLGSLLFASVVGVLPNLSGCDKTKSEHDVEVTHPNGSTESTKEKTVQKPDGSAVTRLASSDRSLLVSVT